MCGICGIWHFDPNRQVDAPALQAMTTALYHRGPDEEGLHIEGSLGLGFRRLSIIDLSRSHQPMPNEDQQMWVVFNGEIYNFQDLRARLVDQHQFKTQGDTETILHSYEEYGAACVEQFRGMFAFAIWDSRQEQLMLAVDRFGKKPMYYLLDDEKILFASEMKGLLQYPGVSRELDLIALNEYFTYGYISAPRTILKAVRKLQPGHTLVIKRDGRAQVGCYWSPALLPPAEQTHRTQADLAAELRHLLTEAVRLRMISDVPLGAFLSGGIDSSAVVGLMSTLSSQPVKTFSIGFNVAGYDETVYARAVAQHWGTDHTEWRLNPDDLLEALPQLMHQFDEPFADASMFPTHYVAKLAREQVTVALSGDGGDEVFGGYHTYFYGARQHFLQQTFPRFSHRWLEQGGANLPKLSTYLKSIRQPVSHWSEMQRLVKAPQLLYSNGFQQELANTPSLRESIYQNTRHLDWLGQLQSHDLQVYLPGDILVKVDRASMMNSLEVRAPLLDHVVFEFMAQIPPRYKVQLRGHKVASKVLLKQAVKDLLPSALQHRNKQGFEIPLKEWLRGKLKPLVHDSLLGNDAHIHNFLDKNAIKTLITRFEDGDDSQKSALWSLLCFELWSREYLKI